MILASQEVRHIVNLIGYCICRCTHRVRPCRAPWWSWRADHSCRDRGRKVPSGKSIIRNHSACVHWIPKMSIDHGRKHATKTPHIQAIVIFLEVDQKFWTLEVTRGDTDIVFRFWVIELGEAPIDEPQLSNACRLRIRTLSIQDLNKLAHLAVFMIYHDVVRFYVSVHDSLGVAVI
jgi:hypothetical protein